MAKDVTASEMDISFRNVELWMGLKVASIRIWSDEAAMTLKPFTFELPQKASMKAIVASDGIASLLARQAPPQLRDIEVKIEPGKLVVSAVAKVGLKIPFSAEAFLAIEERSRLVVKLGSLGKLPGPARDMVAKEIEKVNPLFEASDWPMDVAFTNVACEPGQVVLSGIVNSFTRSKATI